MAMHLDGAMSGSDMSAGVAWPNATRQLSNTTASTIAAPAVGAAPPALQGRRRWGETVIETEPHRIPQWGECDTSGDEADTTDEAAQPAATQATDGSPAPSPHASVRSMSGVSGISGFTPAAMVRDKGDAALRGCLRSDDWDNSRVLAHGDSFLLQLRDPWAPSDECEPSHVSTDASPKSPTLELLDTALHSRGVARLDGMVAQAARKVTRKEPAPQPEEAVPRNTTYANVVDTVPRRRRLRMGLNANFNDSIGAADAEGVSGSVDMVLSASGSTRRQSPAGLQGASVGPSSGESPSGTSGHSSSSDDGLMPDQLAYRSFEHEGTNAHALDTSLFAALDSGEGFVRGDGYVFPSRLWSDDLSESANKHPGDIGTYVRGPSHGPGCLGGSQLSQRPTVRPMSAPIGGPARRLHAAVASAAADDIDTTARHGASLVSGVSTASPVRDLRAHGTRGIHSPLVGSYQAYPTTEMDSSTLRPCPIPGEGAASCDWSALAQLLVPAPLFSSPFMLRSAQEMPSFDGRKTLPPHGKGSFSLKHINLRWLVPPSLQGQAYQWSATGGRKVRLEAGWAPTPPERWLTLGNFDDHKGDMLDIAADKKTANFGAWAPDPNPEPVHLLNSPRSAMVLLKRGVCVEQLLEPDPAVYKGRELDAERAGRAQLLQSLQSDYNEAVAAVQHRDIFAFYRTHWPQRLQTSCAISPPANEYKKKLPDTAKPLAFFGGTSNVFTAKHSVKVAGMLAHIDRDTMARSQKMTDHIAKVAQASNKFQQKKAEDHRRHRQDKKEAREAWFRRKNVKLNQEGFAKAKFLSRHLSVTAAATHAEQARDLKAAYALVGNFRISEARKRSAKRRGGSPVRGASEQGSRLRAAKRPLGVPCVVGGEAAGGSHAAGRGGSLPKPQFVLEV